MTLRRATIPGSAAFAVLLLAAAGCSPSPTSQPSATSGQPSAGQAVAAATQTPAPLPSPTPVLQRAIPRLGGTSWNVIEVDGMPVAEEAWLWIAPGSKAHGTIQSECSFVSFDYAYDPPGASITLAETQAYAEGCSAAALARDAAIRAALPRVAAWRTPGERLELLDSNGALLFVGKPPPPLPSAPPVGECIEVPGGLCQAAATVAFNYGHFLEPGQRVSAWQVRVTKYVVCDGSLEPRYDITFELANPTRTASVTVGSANGGPLYVCTY